MHNAYDHSPRDQTKPAFQIPSKAYKNASCRLYISIADGVARDSLRAVYTETEICIQETNFCFCVDCTQATL